MISIGSQHFRTKEQARLFCRDLLRSYRPGQIVTSEHADFLWCLLQLHHEAVKKIGCGIALFFVEGDEFGGQRFAVKRVDGSTEHFSYPTCLRKPTKREDVSKAMRYEVKQQVIEFKQKEFGNFVSIRCALTGVPVNKDSCEIDHFDPDFVDLRDWFLSAEKKTFEDVPLLDKMDGGATLGDRSFASRWSEYHRQFANLRVTSKEANRARPRRRGE